MTDSLPPLGSRTISKHASNTNPVAPVEGEWKPIHSTKDWTYQSLCEMLLDPEAWKAVGKVEGWPASVHTPMKEDMRGWEFEMHRVIDALASGQTIEQFLATL